ncbi:MAG: MarR family transcriptional regulator [Pseudomonadota bacterium]
MSDPHEIAYLVDRFMRRISANLHHKALRVDVDRVGPFGGMILLTLSDAEPVSMHALVAQMGRDKSQMTRAIKSLEDKGMIERHRCPDDGRVSVLQLTQKGRMFVGDIKAVLAGVIDDILSPVSAEERQNLVEVLRKI